MLDVEHRKQMIRETFKSICREAIEADDAASNLNCRVLEPYFQQLIQIAEDKAALVELKKCFIEIIDGSIEAPYETLAYCMRALKFEEVLEASSMKLGNPVDPRWMNTHSDIAHAISDDAWEDADMWELMK